jgi:hypothetical protein
MLEHSKDIQETVAMPLNKKARKALSRRENEMKDVKRKNLGADFIVEDEDEEFVEEEEEQDVITKTDKSKFAAEIDDPVLKQSVLILDDMIDISNDKTYLKSKLLKQDKDKEDKEDKEKSSLRQFVDGIFLWLKKIWSWISGNIFRL